MRQTRLGARPASSFQRLPRAEETQRACRDAIDAATEAFASLAALNLSRAAKGEGALEIGVALHRGQVMYGNIGARSRLDFTVISSAVNEAARLEALCKPLGVRLTLSEELAKAARLDDIVDLGAHVLKGVRTPLRVFTLGTR